MKHLFGYLAFVVVALSIGIFLKQQKGVETDIRPVVRVLGYTSFVGQWGPGPGLKEGFEKDCNCRIEYFDAADSGLLLQKLQGDIDSAGSDLVIGFDQYDLEKAEKAVSWKRVTLPNLDWEELLTPYRTNSFFIPFDYGLLAFNFKKSETQILPKSLDDLLNPNYARKISLEDPRTSSPGLQFLFWLVQLKGEDGAFKYLAKLGENIHSISPSWSTAYGLFQKGQAKTVFSYVTSPIYHLVEEKNSDFVAAEFTEGHPMQVEFMGVPSSCKSCDLGEKFLRYIVSVEGQKIVMSKNYMLPVVRGVRKGTAFENLPSFKSLEHKQIPNIVDRERILQRWAEFRRSNGF